MTMKIKFLQILFLIISIYMVQTSNLYAQDSAITPQVPPSSPAESIQIGTAEIKGEILTVDNNSLIVKTDDGQTREFNVDGNVSVKRNTMTSSVSELKPGDGITITRSQNGEIIALSATSGEIFDWGKWLLPVIIIGLVLAFLITWFLRQANKSHIKTTET